MRNRIKSAYNNKRDITVDVKTINPKDFDLLFDLYGEPVVKEDGTTIFVYSK